MSMISKRARFSIAASAAAMFVATSAALASPLPIGGTLFPAPAEPDPVGGVVIDSMVSPFLTPTFSGTLVTYVISGDVSNPLGGLTFAYRAFNDGTSAHPLSRVTMNGYTGWLTDASYQVPAAGIAATLINRPTADFVGFSYMDVIGPGLITPGASSALMVVQTNAPAYTINAASVIDGYVATVPTFAPIPEPATMALLGLGALAFRRRK